MDNKNKAIGVFDSGLGGVSVLKELIKSMPNEKFIYFFHNNFVKIFNSNTQQIFY